MHRPLRFSLVASRVAPTLCSLLLTACAGKAQQPPPVTPIGYAPTSMPAGARVGSELLYRLPVLGTWKVARTHVGSTRDQAFAFDIVMNSPDGKPFVGDGKRNTDFPAYGQPVVADAPGIVAIAVDGIPENQPGVVNAYDQHGNYVVIDHRNGEFSLVAHLIPGSLRVRAGQPVNAGSELGRCGNTGLSTAPHVHWQVMDNPFATTAHAILQRYQPYDRNGQMYNGMPAAGDTITAH